MIELALAGLVYLFNLAHAPAPSLFGDQGISQLQLVKSTSTPFNAITVSTHGKDLYIPFSHATTSALAVTGLSGCDTIDTDSFGNLKCGTDASGAGGGSFPFTPNTNYGALTNATGTPLWLQAGFQASSTSYLVYASTTALSGTSLCLGTDCRTAWPTSSGGSGNVATSTAETAGQLSYWTSTAATPATLGKVATGTLSASSPLSLTGTTVIIGTSRTLSLDTSGAWSGTAGALAADGANCSSGSAPLGVDALGAVQSCFDVWTEAENTSAAYLAAITADYPLQGSGTSASHLTLAFGTTTANTWSAFNNFTYGIKAALSSTTNATTTGSFYLTGLSPGGAGGLGIDGNGRVYSGATSTLSTITGSLALTQLAAQAANTVVANGTGASAAPTALSTSSLFAAGTAGNVLTYTSAGTWVPSATTTFVNGTGITTSMAGNALTITNAGVTSNVAGTGIAVSGATGAVTITNTVGFPFTPTTYAGQAVNSTSTAIWLTSSAAPLSLIASSTFATNATTTNATTTNLKISGQLNFGSGTGLLYGSSGVVSNLSNGVLGTNGVLGISAGVPAFVSTTTLFAAGTPGNVLTYTAAGTWVPSATTTFVNGTGITTSMAGNALTITNAGVTSNVAGAGIAVSGATGAVTITNTVGFPFTAGAYNGQIVNSTSTALWLTALPLSLIASSTFATNATTTNATSTNLYVSGQTRLASLSGLLKASTGVVTTAAAGTDYLTGSGTQGQLAYWGASNALTNVATTTVTCAGTVSCSTFTAIGASPFTITGSGGGANPAWATTSPYANALVLYPADQTNEDVVFGSNAGSTTTAPFWWDVSATSTYIGNGGTGTSSLSFSGASTTPSSKFWNIGAYASAQNGSGNFVIASSSNDNDLVTNPFLTITQAGNVGISTSTPTALLHLSTSSSLTTITNSGGGLLALDNLDSTANNFSAIDFGQKGSSARTVQARIAAQFVTHGAIPTSELAFLTSSAGSLSERVRISTGGNLGVGTSTPNKLLHIYGNQTGGIARIERRTAGVANSIFGTYDIAFSNTGADTDLTGAAQTFSYIDSNGVANVIGDIATVRDGANNTGTMYLRPYGGGTPFATLTIKNSTTGLVGIATSTPIGALQIADNTGVRYPQLVISGMTNGVDKKHWFASTTSAGGLSFGTINDALTTLTTQLTMTTGLAVGGTSTPLARLQSVSLFGSLPLNNWHFSIASSTRTATTTLWGVNEVGHIIASSTAPTVISGASAIWGNDTVGSTTASTGTGKLIYIQFAYPWRDVPHCFVGFDLASSTLTSGTSTILSTSATNTTQFAIAANTANMGGSKINYQCMGSRDGTHY